MKNKSSVWLVVVLFLFVARANGQMLKVEGGMAFSKLRTQGLNEIQFFDKSVKPFQMSVGVEYLDKEHFNLSSSIGYLRTGGKDKIIITGGGGEILNSNFEYKYLIDYLIVNTLFNIRKTDNRTTYYIGVGPRLDFKLGSSKNVNQDLENSDELMPELNKVIFGLKCEAGIWYDLDDKFRIGANVGYLPSFTKAWTSPVAPDVTMTTRSFTLGISLGYVL